MGEARQKALAARAVCGAIGLTDEAARNAALTAMAQALRSDNENTGA